ncbi:hypothetical protein [Lacticaseibacillus daqingensis]|uniref:hypothetical protein n=1 Tax=Lacticaseibacillus daqingensis TaxID=2486014 RepID=UPI000F7A7953|nr:hypothetical protein [Lacticaseibacillus daqingensis]
MTRHTRGRLNRILLTIEIALMVSFLVGHATPNLAVRCRLLTMGHPLAAVTADIVVKKTAADVPDHRLYEVRPGPRNRDGSGDFALDTYTVKRVGLSFATLDLFDD